MDEGEKRIDCEGISRELGECLDALTDEFWELTEAALNHRNYDGETAAAPQDPIQFE